MEVGCWWLLLRFKLVVVEKGVVFGEVVDMVFECSGGIWFLMCVGGGDGECCDEVSVGVVYGGIVVFL